MGTLLVDVTMDSVFSCRLMEHVASSQSPIVDAVNRTIRGVLLIGHRSKNGYTYPRACLESAAPKYEGVKVYVDHPPRDKVYAERSVRDIIGRVTSPFYDVSSGIRGNITLIESELTKSVLASPEMYGLSSFHACRVDRKKNPIMIESVRSVDLVANPATSKHLMESHDPAPGNDVAKSYAELRGRLARAAGDTTILAESQAYDGPAQTFAELKERLSR